MESEVLSQTRSLAHKIRHPVHEECLNYESHYEDGRKSAGIFRTTFREGLMALVELFVPNMSQLYRATAQLLGSRLDFGDSLYEDIPSTLQVPRQFQVHHKLSTYLRRTVGKAAAMRFMQAVKAQFRRARRSRSRGLRKMGDSPKHNSLGSQPELKSGTGRTPPAAKSACVSKLFRPISFRV